MMGRLQQLERLALGRSPFQDVESSKDASTNGVDDNGQRAPSSGCLGYDAKGRPVNSITEQHNQDMRNAQNAVLSLVGVVESTDALNLDLQLAARHVHILKSKLLEAEQDRGDDLDLFAPLLHRLVTWWPDILLFKIQAGVFAGSLSMASIIQSALHQPQPNGIRGVLRVILQGFPLWLLLRTSKMLICAGLGEAIGHLQQMLNKRMSRKRMKQANAIIGISCELIPIAIDVMFLPLQYLAISQSLGLIPASRPTTDWRLLLPWNTALLRSNIWTPAYGAYTAFAKLTSPAAIMLLRNFLERDQGDGLPIAHQFTSFEWPAINAPRKVIGRLKDTVRNDPFGRLLFQCYLARVKLMRWLGWNLEYLDEHPQAARKYQNNCAPPRQSSLLLEATSTGHVGEAHPSTSRFRSTSLAHQPAQFLSDAIDGFFTKLMMLPIDGLTARTIAQSYLQSGLSLSRQALDGAAHMYSLSGGGPLGGLWSLRFNRSAWREFGSYVDKLGLALAMRCAGDLAVFFVIYGFCRWQGVATFDWGDAIENRERQIAKDDDGLNDEQNDNEVVP